MLQFSCISELKTVYSTLESKNALDLLQDEYVAVGLYLPQFYDYLSVSALFC